MAPVGRFIELLRNVEHALAELSDSKEQLEALEELLEGFEKVERTTRSDIDRLRRELARETLSASQLRVRVLDAEVLCRKTAIAWRKARQIACMETTDAEKALDEQLQRMGWYDETQKHEK